MSAVRSLHVVASLVAALSCLALLACGGATPTWDNLRLARTLQSDLGPLEDEAEALTRGLVDALTAPATSPEAALDRLSDFIATNTERMSDVAAAISTKLDTLSADEARAYHEVLAERMSEPVFEWRGALATFRAEHPEHVDALEAAIEPLGPNRE